MQLNYNNEKVTKARESLMRRAENYKFSESQKFIIAKAELPTDKLTIILNYIRIQNNSGLDKENVTAEVKRCLQLYNPFYEFTVRYNKNMYLRFLLPEYRKDTLFGLDKKKIIANVSYINHNNRDVLVYNLFSLIYNNYPADIISLLMKALMSATERFGYELPYGSEYIKKDLFLNKTDSLLYQCVVRQYFVRDYKSIENLLKNNQYLIDEGLAFKIFMQLSQKREHDWIEGRTVYGIDPEKLSEWLNSKNVFAKLLQEKYPEYKTDIEEERYSELTKILPETNMVLKVPSNSIKTAVYQGTVNVSLGHHENISIWYKDNDYRYSPGGANNLLALIIFPNNSFFEKSNNKFLPLQLKRIHRFYHTSALFKSFFDYLFDVLEVKHPIIKDIRREIVQERWYLPISLNELLVYHNKKELFKAQYKAAIEMKTDFNKLSFNMAYILVKTYSYVDDKSKGILQNIKDPSLFELDSWKYKDNIMGFITNYYEKKGIVDNYLVKDYVNMCMLAKMKVSLCYNSIAKLKQAHDHVAENAAKKGTGKVKVPKNSKFTELREILPNAFTWIQSRKRLMQEANMQHHCVWSYADKISSDRCAIYSYLDTTGTYTDDWKGVPERYTIEFTIGKNGYEISQAQGSRNQKSTEKINEYISSFLKQEAEA